MRLRAWFLLLPALLAGCMAGLELPRRAVQAFSADSARRYVEYLASDELQGRNTPSPGLLQAAEYIAAAFRRWGLQPVQGRYEYPYELVRRDLERDSLVLRLWRGDTLWQAAIPEQAVPSPFTGEGHLRGARLLVVAQAQLDSALRRADSTVLQDAVVLLVRARRRQGEGDTATEGRAGVSLSGALRLLSSRGVRGVLLVDPPERAWLRPMQFPWPSLSPGLSPDMLPLRLVQESRYPIVYSIGGEVIEALFGSRERFREYLSRGQQEQSLQEVPGVQVELRVAFREVERVEVPNVVGMLVGREYPQEYVVIGAHFDHVGVVSARGKEQDTIYNGADDNASGTAGLMLIARALSQLPKPPRRSILFVAFSGEEKGLLGSRAFVRKPPFPLENCIAMLNLDMIGRNHPDSLSVGVRPAGLRELIERENRRLRHPFVLGQRAEEFFGRSDHASFAEVGIPVAFFFTGLHEDYHRPSDHAEKLDYGKLSRVALLAARVAWQLAERGREAIGQ